MDDLKNRSSNDFINHNIIRMVYQPNDTRLLPISIHQHDFDSYYASTRRVGPNRKAIQKPPGIYLYGISSTMGGPQRSGQISADGEIRPDPSQSTQ